jgi:hypothetical protein
MAFDIWLRAQAKWRGVVVYTLLEAVSRAVTDYIYQAAGSRELRLYALIAGLATTIFCLTQTVLLLMKDRDGDDAWPSIWS